MARTSRIGFLLLALAPLAYLPGVFTHDDVPKRLVVSLAAFLLLVAGWAPALRGCALEIRRDRLVLPFALAWGASLVSFLVCVVHGGNPYEGFWPLFLPACGILLYLAVSNLPGDARFVRETLPRWVIGAACVVSAFGLLQRAGIDPFNPSWTNPDREAGSTFGGKTFAGEYLALVFPLALAAVFSAVSAAGRAVAGGAALLIGAHLLVTGARGAWLGAGGGVVLVMALGLLKRAGPEGRRAIPLRVAAAAAGVLLAVAVLAQLVGAADWVGRIRGAVAPQPGRDTMLVRRELWKSTAIMAADHPVFGVGPGQYDLNIQPYRSVAERIESDPQRLGRSAGMAHNDFLQHVAETGALGGAALVLLLYALVRKSAAHLKAQEDRGAFLLAAGLLGGVLAAAGAGLAGYALHQPAVGALAMLFLGMAERVGNPSGESRPLEATPRVRAGGALVLGAVALCGGAGIREAIDDGVYARFLASESRIEIHGKGPWTGGASAWLDESMGRPIPWGGPDRWEIRRSLGLVYMRSAHPQDRRKAVAHLERARTLNPNDPETWNAWGQLCRTRDQRDAGREAFERAVHLDPIVRAPRMNLALTYEQDGLFEKAVAEYGVLLLYDANDAEAHFGRGHALSRLGRHAEAAGAFGAASRAGYVREGRDARAEVRRLDSLRAFRESEAGRRWLAGGP